MCNGLPKEQETIDLTFSKTKLIHSSYVSFTAALKS